MWYSDDNAIVREKFRKEVVRLVTPHFAVIIRQGVAEGVFTLTQPEQMARVVLSLILDTGDEAGELYRRAPQRPDLARRGSAAHYDLRIGTRARSWRAAGHAATDRRNDPSGTWFAMTRTDLTRKEIQ